MVTFADRTAIDIVFDPLVQCFTPEVAQRIVDFSLDPQVQSRLNVLADKANEGTLTSAELQEYEDYVEAIDVLTLVQAKARLALSHRDKNS